jgi:hypothetical protein
MWHSCTRYRVDDHFTGKDPIVRKLFDRYLALVRRCGPVTVYAQKTRIVFQNRVRFAGAAPRNRWLEGRLWLKRRVVRFCEGVPGGQPSQGRVALAFDLRSKSA